MSGQVNLKVTICDSPEDAIDRGYNYSAEPEKYKGARIVEAVVVRNGTVSGESTIDFIFENEEGQKYVVLITANLIRLLGDMSK